MGFLQFGKQLQLYLQVPTFRDELEEIQFMYHHYLRTRSLSIAIRKLLFVTILLGFVRFTYLNGTAEPVRYAVMATAWIVAAICQGKLMWDLQKKELVPQHETLKAYSVVINMTAAMIVSSMTAADEVPMSSPWIVALYQAGLILGDRIRVQAAAQLLWLNILCFFFAEASWHMVDTRPLWRVIVDCLVVGLFGILVPRVLLTMMETEKRQAFRKDMDRRGVEGMAAQFKQGLIKEFGY